MGFFSPWFLAGLAAVGLPVYFHLLRQHRSAPRPFSSLMLFERSTQSSIRHRRLRYLSLLALRVALLVLLALAFAAPYVMRSAAAGAGGPKLLVLVVDNSFSMRAGNRLERAKREAIAAVSRLGEGDEGQVATLGSRLDFLTSPTPRATELTAAIRSITPGDAHSSFGELARALRSLAETSSVPLEVHLFSDMQRTSMPDTFADLQLAAGVRLELHPAAQAAVPNFAVESVTAPASLFDPSRVRVQATIAGYGTGAARRTVSLVANGRVLETRTVAVPAGGRATVEFLSLGVPYGFNRCEVRIDSADSLAADDRFRFAVERGDPEQVLFVERDGAARDLLYFRAAVEASPAGAFRLRSVTAGATGDMDPARYAVVVLSDTGGLPEAFARRLQQYVRTGGSVLVAAGPATARLARIPVIGAPVLESSYSSRSGQRFQTVGYADPAHPAVKNAGRWEGVKFYQAVRVEPGGARVLARLGDGTPLLVEWRLGEGRVLLFTSTFDNIANDFPLYPSFVAFVDEALLYLGGVEQHTAVRMVDSFLDLRTGSGPARGVEIRDPDGNRALSLEEAAEATTYRLAREGFYEVHRGGDRGEMVAVNADRREADLAIVSPERLALWQNTGEGPVPEGAEAETRKQPWSLWWYVLLAALAVAVGESLLAAKYLTVERGTA